MYMSFFLKKRNLLVPTILILLLLNIYVMLKIQNINIYTFIQNGYFSFSNLVSKKPTCKNCNIILISIDTLGANHLPCYGYARNTSPNLCKFGEENIFVKDMSANSSYTLASHTSLFTGLYPHEHGVNIPNVDRLNKNISFLPEELKKNGYETYFCMTTSDPHLPIDKVYNRGIDQIYETYKLEHWDTCLKKLELNNKENKKTFIFLHTYRVHAPYLTSPESTYNSRFYSQKIPSIPETEEEYFSMKYDEDYFRFFIQKLEEDLTNKYWGENNATVDNYTNVLTHIKGIKTKSERYRFINDIQNEYIIHEYLGAYYFYKINLPSKKEINRLSDIYDIAIMEVDSFLGKMLNSLRKSNLWNNTIIAITSDHGEEFMEHDKVVGHGANLYNTTTRVPLIMRVPNIQKRNVVMPAESVDIFPTLLDIVGIKDTLKLSGSNIFGIKNKIQKGDLFYNNYYIRTIRDGNWKLIIKKENSTYSARELYNVSIDPDEKNNRIFENRTEANRLLQIFRDNQLKIQKK